MTWPEPVNICDERTAYVDLTQFDDVPKELWTDLYGKRRKRFQPDTLSIYWHRGMRVGTKWKIRQITVSGVYLHKQAGNLRLTKYLDGSELWAVPLIELTRPKEGS